jgi:hypothetical protein
MAKIYQMTSILPEVVSRLPLCFLPVRLDRELKDPVIPSKSAAKAVIVVLTASETFGLFCNSATRASACAFWSSTELLRSAISVNKIMLTGQVQSRL